MEELLQNKLNQIIPKTIKKEVLCIAKSAVIDTKFSPTINLNGIFSVFPDDINLQQKVQSKLEELMNELLILAKAKGLKNSFFLHVAPNLGKVIGKERIKFASNGDIGTTDIQFMLSGAIKEAGLLVLINKFILGNTGSAPFGEKFNVRNSTVKCLP